MAASLVVGGGWWASGRTPDGRSSLSVALDSQPAGTQVVGFTDWRRIRDDLDLGDGGTAADRAALSDDAALRDLTTRSALGQSIDDMHRLYGWSAADLDWESYGQSTAGSAVVAGLSPSVSIDAVESRLGRLGYTRTGDVWTLSTAGSREVGNDLARLLGSVVVLPRERLVVATDRSTYVSRVLDVIRGHGRSLLARRPVLDVATSLAGSDSVLIQTAAFGCAAASVADQGADVAGQARAAVTRAGGLARPTWLGRGLVDGRRSQRISFVASFTSPATAIDQVGVRAALAKGPFIGRTGQIEDSLRLTRAEAEGAVATLKFRLDPDKGAYMSGEGPLLFASCPT